MRLCTVKQTGGLGREKRGTIHFLSLIMMIIIMTVSLRWCTTSLNDDESIR